MIIPATLICFATTWMIIAAMWMIWLALIVALWISGRTSTPVKCTLPNILISFSHALRLVLRKHKELHKSFQEILATDFSCHTDMNYTLSIPHGKLEIPKHFGRYHD